MSGINYTLGPILRRNSKEIEESGIKKGRKGRKGNPLTLLVGMQTNTATMENSVEIP